MEKGTSLCKMSPLDWLVVKPGAQFLNVRRPSITQLVVLAAIKQPEQDSTPQWPLHQTLPLSSYPDFPQLCYGTVTPSSPKDLLVVALYNRNRNP